MTDKTAEQLSALMDGELETQEIDLLVRRLERDDELAARWARYHLIGEAMRNNLPEQLPFDLGARVSAAIAEEAPIGVAPLPARRAWTRPAIGLALAASVAAGALIGIPPQRAIQPEATPVAVTTPAVPARTVVADAGWERNERLNALLMSHNESATMNQMSGVIPYARMVGYEEGR